MVRGLALFAVLVSAGLLAALPGRAQEVSIKILVNDEPISDYDIAQRERFLALTTKEQPSPELKKKSTDMIIDEHLQMQEGRKLGVTPDEEDVTKIIEDMASKNNLDVAGLTTALGKAGATRPSRTASGRSSSGKAWSGRNSPARVQIGEADVDQALADSGEDEEQSSVRVEQVRLELPSGADQRVLAAKLAAAEALRARFTGCGNVTDMAKGVEGATVKTLLEQQATNLAQPARLLVQNAKVGQMTPPTVSHSGVELYAVCGNRAVTSDGSIRETAQRKLMNEEMMIRAERLLRDLRQDAFIEYR
ncbi:hypothetical protein AUC71_14665 [Methyloceanibacter marginalis]|uniref:SurA N-terminal domain-containing protein n=2 Tax=Methyloceanibacter marginalis TaxID=1774971 RepID=A0A1E3W9T2_9HYPH|nr:hypothetical protein AUC71_14665 [Methyloceanibacter marginalis]